MPDAAVLPYGENLADMEIRKAAVLFLAAKSGDVVAQFELGVAYKYGKGGVSRSDTHAAKWFAEAAKRGHAGAIYELVSRYARNTTLNKDLKMVLKLATYLAEKGDPKVQCELGHAYLSSDEMERNDELAAKWISLSAQQGYAKAQLLLSGMYFSGTGVPQNSEKGVFWALSSAEQGDVEAQLAVGNLYMRGIGVAEDWTLAREWFVRAARQGSRRARHQISIMDEYEIRGNKDGYSASGNLNDKENSLLLAFSNLKEPREYFKTAMKFLAENDERSFDYRLILPLIEKSAEQGYVPAMIQLAKMYIHGVGLEKNISVAANWMAQAAELGNMDAQYEIGLMYEKGEGVIRSVRRAWDWYFAAARQGHFNAVRALTRINGAPVEIN